MAAKFERLSYFLQPLHGTLVEVLNGANHGETDPAVRFAAGPGAADHRAGGGGGQRLV